MPVSSLLSPMAPLLTTMPMLGSGPVWPMSSPICMCTTCGGISAPRENGPVRKEARCLGQAPALPIAMMVLVRDPAHQGECQIHYKDIGDYLTREQKLQAGQGQQIHCRHCRLADLNTRCAPRLAGPTRSRVSDLSASSYPGQERRGNSAGSFLPVFSGDRHGPRSVGLRL